jgi:hypothetical protein
MKREKGEGTQRRGRQGEAEVHMAVGPTCDRCLLPVLLQCSETIGRIKKWTWS